MVLFYKYEVICGNFGETIFNFGSISQIFTQKISPQTLYSLGKLGKVAQEVSLQIFNILACSKAWTFCSLAQPFSCNRTAFKVSGNADAR